MADGEFIKSDAENLISEGKVINTNSCLVDLICITGASLLFLVSS